MRVLYVHPQAVEGGGDFAFVPAGVAGVLNHLRRQGVGVEGIDAALEARLDPGFDLRRAVRRATFDAALVGLHWYVHADGALRAARAVKEAAGRPVVVGGHTAAFFWRELMEASEDVDAVAFGDCEAFLQEALEAIAAGDARRLHRVPNVAFRGEGGEPVRTALRASPVPIDELDYVGLSFLRHWRELLALREGERVPGEHGAEGGEPRFFLPVHRGCDMACPCCGGSSSANALLAGRRRAEWRSAAVVASDLRRLEGLGVREVRFSAPLRHPLWPALLDELERDPPALRASFECWDVPEPALVGRLLERFPGAPFVLTPLSGDEGVRRANGKPFTNEEVLAAARAVADGGGRQAHYLFPNLVGARPEGFGRTIAFCQELLDATPPERASVHLGVMELDPASDAFVRPEANGTVHYRWSFEDIVRWTRLGRLDNVPYTSREMGRDEVMECMEAWRRELRGRANALVTGGPPAAPGPRAGARRAGRGGARARRTGSRTRATPPRR